MPQICFLFFFVSFLNFTHHVCSKIKMARRVFFDVLELLQKVLFGSSPWQFSKIFPDISRTTLEINRGVIRALLNICDVAFLQKKLNSLFSQKAPSQIIKGLKLLTIFVKNSLSSLGIFRKITSKILKYSQLNIYDDGALLEVKLLVYSLKQSFAVVPQIRCF